jgi:hypothetical protein
MPEGLIPIEPKLNFSRTLPASLNAFAASYHTLSIRLAGLNGDPAVTAMIHPWQLP